MQFVSIHPVIVNDDLNVMVVAVGVVSVARDAVRKALPCSNSTIKEQTASYTRDNYCGPYQHHLLKALP